ncbi:TrmH family RNA methyltransferase [Bordetella genomosp. 9]|uniref:RNA methyltransferase n=1 Tax=Bordetella genomosp. 9 TaxID=1416803 RepID=A0A1W6Z126_9BORD|nr:RNA methyltransferase [Bordetella genomosp. 9]ARP86894.1 RNA methyltransferase [Bordetella genomosp. 9]ARP90880.1 RNA methyltransferase [Bordetella genomosp. 9]
MKHIASRENPLVKSLYRVASASGRRESQVLLDGVHLCQAWLRHYGPPARALFDAARLDRPELADLAAALPDNVCVSLESRLLQGLASVESGQGVAFLVHPPQPPLPERIEESCLLLDRVQDPGNVGTLIRTCAAAGIRRVLLSEGCASAWSPKVLRSAQGAHFAVALHEKVALEQALPRLAVPVVATALQESISLYDANLPPVCAWVFGHEGQGIAPALLRAASLRVRIPHDTSAVESLNVAAAAAICLFEQRRRFPGVAGGE